MRVRAAVIGLVLVLAAACGGAGDDGAGEPTVSGSSGLATPTSTPATSPTADAPPSSGADPAEADGAPSRASAVRAATQAVQALLDDGRSSTADVLAAGLSGYVPGRATALVFTRVTTAVSGASSTTVEAIRVLLLQQGDGWRVGGTGVDDVLEPVAARADAMAVASDFVTALTTFDAPGYAGYQERLRPLVTGAYGRTVGTSVAQLKATGVKATSSGTVDGTAVQRIGPARARVLVSSSQTFRTTSEQVQQNRMVVDVRRDGDAWKVAGVETLS